MDNYMELKIKAVSGNESFARSAVAAFVTDCNITVDWLGDLKTAVSEAVTNSIVHGYESSGEGDVIIKVVKNENAVHISVKDYGVGIADPVKAREPFYTTKGDRSGMGFTVMESFTDSLKVTHNTPSGTVVSMEKAIRGAGWKEKKSSN